MMKKTFNLYVIIWAVLLATFNAVAFIVPAWPDYEKFTASFWIGYAAIGIAMIGQLVCAWMAFKEENIRKTFYNISLYIVSYVGLATTFAVGAAIMVISPLPYWIGAVVCLLVLAGNLISVIKTKMAVDLVTESDERAEQTTAFMYRMREESRSLVAMAASDRMKAICQRVSDAFRFSDPVSNKNLATVESEIGSHFASLKKAVTDDKPEDATVESGVLLTLISERNNKCKRLK